MFVYVCVCIHPYIYISYLIYLLMNTSSFHILAVINNAAIGVYVYFLICDIVFFRSIPRSGIARS